MAKKTNREIRLEDDTAQSEHYANQVQARRSVRNVKLVPDGAAGSQRRRGGGGRIDG